MIDGSKVRAFTRNGHDWSARYKAIIKEAAGLASSGRSDGGVITLNQHSLPDFAGLRSTITRQPERLVFVAFDLLHLGDKDLRALPLLERKELLWQAIAPAEGRIQYSQHVEEDGRAFFKAVEKMELEGMVSKRADSRYRSGPSKTWLKIKCFTESEFEVVGVLRKPGNPPMALMATREAKPRYVGSAIIALNERMRERLWARVSQGTQSPLSRLKRAGVEPVAPGLVGRVRHLKGADQ